MSKLYSNFILNKRNNVIFAYVPKVACSNWKGIMRSLNGDKDHLNTVLAHNRDLSGLDYLSNKTNPYEFLKSERYKKYAFVRNPYSRILSAYLNKIESRIGVNPSTSDHFYKVFQDIEKYREEHFDVKTYPEVNFYIFLNWLKNSGSIYIFDEHWKAQSQLLDIKNVKFDRIGKFENLSSEADDFIALLGANVKFPTQKQIKFESTGAVSKIEKYYDKDCYDLVNAIYRDDFDLFDYPRHLDVSKPKITLFKRSGKKSKIIEFDSGEHIITSPIELDSFDILKGKGKDQTVLKVIGSFQGPFIRTKRLEDNITNAHWFYEEGVPVRFSIKDLTLDLSEWKPRNLSDNDIFPHGNISIAAVALYGKAFEIKNVLVMNSIGSGLISICSARGGKKDLYLDAPEAKIDGLEVINTKEDGVVFAGPHDSILKELLVSHSKKKGVYIVADKKFSGACDIDFIHAYATDGVAIDVQAKVKARLLQGDTGRGSGVVLGGSNKTIVDTIEVFKTRGIEGDYSVKIECSEAQIATVRIRADAGAGGMALSGFGNTITSLHIESNKVHPDFSHLKTIKTNYPLCVTGNQNSILDGRIYSKGGEDIKGPTTGCVKRFLASLTLLSPSGSNFFKDELFQLSEIKIKIFKTYD